MIKLNETFSFDRDNYAWTLYEMQPGRDKDGNPKPRKVTTYHSTLRQICRAVIDRTAGGCESMGELRSLLKSTENWIAVEVETKVPHK